MADLAVTEQAHVTVSAAGVLPRLPLEVWFVDQPALYSRATMLMREQRNGRAQAQGDELKMVFWRTALNAETLAAGRKLPPVAARPGVWIYYSDGTWEPLLTGSGAERPVET